MFSIRRAVRRVPLTRALLPVACALLLPAPALAVTVTESPALGVSPSAITAGPDGQEWFGVSGAAELGHTAAIGTAPAYVTLPVSTARARALTAGPSGALWYLDYARAKVGRTATNGATTEFTDGQTTTGTEATAATAGAITAGPDGNLWYVDDADNGVFRMSPTGVVHEFTAGMSPGARPVGIAAGPDGNLWFVEQGADKIGRITTAGTITEFSAGLSAGAGLSSIAPGSDGSLWFTEPLPGNIGRITPAGAITEFPVSASSDPEQIAAGPDGLLWFADPFGAVGRVTLTGEATQYTSGIHTGGDPTAIAAGADGAVWFTEASGGRLGRITTDASGTGQTTTTPPLPPAPPVGSAPVPSPPPPPVARFTAPSSVRPHAPLILSASGATYPAGSTLDWDLNGDGRTDIGCAAGQDRLQTRFASSGPRTVELQIVAPDGATSRFRQTISVGAAGARSASVLPIPPDQVIACSSSTPSAVGDLTLGGGPGELCSTQVRFGIIEAIGCLHEVTSLDQLPAPERRMLEFLGGNRVHAPVPYAGTGTLTLAAGAPVAGRRPAVPSAPVLGAVASGGIYVSDSAVRINGIDYIPSDGSAIVISVPDRAILSSSASLRIGAEADVAQRRIEQYLPVSATSVYVGGTGIGGLLGGLPIHHASLTFIPAATRIAATLVLGSPSATTTTGQTTVTADDHDGLRLDGARMTGISFTYDNGAVTLRNGSLAYRGNDDWAGTVDIGGQLTVPGATWDFNGCCYESISGSWVRGLGDAGRVSFDHVATLQGTIAREVRGPSGFRAAYRGPFTLHLDTAEQPFTGAGDLRVTADGGLDLSLFANLTFLQDGFDVSAGLIAPDLFAPAVTWDGLRVAGAISSGTFELDGGVRGSGVTFISGLPGLTDARWAAGPQGAFLCGQIGPHSGSGDNTAGSSFGVVRRWGQHPEVGRGCDWQNLSIAASRSAPTATGALTMPDGLPAALVGVRGNGTAPDVTLIDPHGTRVSGPAAGQASSSGAGSLAVRAGDTTFFVLTRPAAGRWQVSAAPGSAGVAGLTLARRLPPVQVTASVAGRGTERVLRYHVARIPGQRVIFTATSAGGRQRIAAIAGGGAGSVRFTPLPGLGSVRRLTADVTQDAAPRAHLALGSFAGGMPLPAPGGARLHRRRGQLSVRWHPVTGAVRYVVRMDSHDNRHLVQAVDAHRLRAAFTLGPEFGRATVRIQAVGADGRAGAARIARIGHPRA